MIELVQVDRGHVAAVRGPPVGAAGAGRREEGEGVHHRPGHHGRRGGQRGAAAGQHQGVSYREDVNMLIGKHSFFRHTLTVTCPSQNPWSFNHTQKYLVGASYNIFLSEQEVDNNIFR